MTSRYEGFGNVLAHARWNSNYIISTDVGGACDMTDNWKYGSKVEQDDAQQLALIFKDVLLTYDKFKFSYEFSSGISYNVTMSNLLIRFF